MQEPTSHILPTTWLSNTQPSTTSRIPQKIQSSPQPYPSRTSSAMATAAVDFITDGFPAPGLRKTQRLITGHGADGKGHFLVTDSGDHHRVMGEKQAVAVIPYSTHDNPVELNGDEDIEFARENEVINEPRRAPFFVSSPGLSNGRHIATASYACRRREPLKKQIQPGTFNS